MTTKPRPNPFRCDAFTLIDLLVVLGTIALMAAALIPALAGPKPNSQAFQCLNNLRQWGAALQTVASDNNDMIPRDGTDNNSQYASDTGATAGPGSPGDPYAWFNAAPAIIADKGLSNYFNLPGGNSIAKLPFPGGQGRIWHCPAAKAAANDFFMAGGNSGFFSYVMNIHLKATTPIEGSYGRLPYPSMPKASSVPKPSATVLMTEVAFSPTLETYLGTASDASRNGVFPCADSYRFAKRHTDSGVIVFVDGRAAMFKRSYITNGAPNDIGVNRAEKLNPDVIWDIYR
jgi:type II secretory pathway pseudopilin PulG